jgi:hypothetical protein
MVDTTANSYSISRSNRFIACMLEVLDTWASSSNEAANASIEAVDVSLRGLAQECFPGT